MMATVTGTQQEFASGPSRLNTSNPAESSLAGVRISTQPAISQGARATAPPSPAAPVTTTATTIATATAVEPESSPAHTRHLSLLEDRTTLPGLRHPRRASLRAAEALASVKIRKSSKVKVAKRFFSHTASSISRSINPNSNSNSMPSVTLEEARAGPVGGGITGIPSHAQSLPQPQLPAGRPRSRSTNAIRSPPRCKPTASPEKPLASTSGGSVSVSIVLAEPVLFLRGFDQSDRSYRSSTMLRGSLIVRVLKPTKIKTVNLTFRGRSRTEWPEGIPLRKSEFFEEKALMNHTWPFFNCAFPTAELGPCADAVRLYDSPVESVSSSSESNLSVGSAMESLARSASPIPIGRTGKGSETRLSLQGAPARNFGKESGLRETVASRGYRIFQPGEYIYNFELPIESCLPETLEVDYGSIRYELEAIVERSGPFRPRLSGRKEVVLIRCPSDHSLETSEPIAISRDWEDQLHYEVVISGKTFPLGSSVPIAFKLVPLSKVKCHRIKIYVAEHVEYSCQNRKIHRIEPSRKLLLFDKRSNGTTVSAFAGSSATIVPGSGVLNPDAIGDSVLGVPTTTPDNFLGELNAGEFAIGPTEMEFNVQLPGCNVKEKDRLHFDTTGKDIRVHHWIKVVLRLSKSDPANPSKRRFYEISIESPIHFISCRATQANTTLPAYENPTIADPGSDTCAGACLCPRSSRRRSPSGSGSSSHHRESSSADPRPIHLFGVPSHNPPPFDADTVMTAPPTYDTVFGNVDSALADYFSRLADEDTDSYSDEGAGAGLRLRGLDLPLTPAGRATRSLDETRLWGHDSEGQLSGRPV